MYSHDAQDDDQARADGFLVLVIEDDALDFTVLERQLRDVPMFRLLWVQSMQDGLTELASNDFDLILLDLSLPDSRGLSTVEAFTERARTPVVVVSGLDDEDTALKAVQHGAQDYLVKGQYSTALICKTLRYAVERYRLLEELNQTREQIQRERELRRLESDVAQLPPAISMGSQATKALQENYPLVHRFAVEEYSRLLELAVERLGYKTTFNASLPLRELAIALGGYKATPRDVVNIHTMSVEVKSSARTSDKRLLRNEEARYLLTGLLGHLCSFYLAQGNELPADSPPRGPHQAAPTSGSSHQKTQ